MPISSPATRADRGRDRIDFDPQQYQVPHPP